MKIIIDPELPEVILSGPSIERILDTVGTELGLKMRAAPVSPRNGYPSATHRGRKGVDVIPLTDVKEALKDPLFREMINKKPRISEFLNVCVAQNDWGESGWDKVNTQMKWANPRYGYDARTKVRYVYRLWANRYAKRSKKLKNPKGSPRPRDVISLEEVVVAWKNEEFCQTLKPYLRNFIHEAIKAREWSHDDFYQKKSRVCSACQITPQTCLAHRSHVTDAVRKWQVTQ